MATYRVTVDYTSKFVVSLEADSPQEASVAAMRALKAADAEAGPVGYVVEEEGVVVAEQRAWGGRKKR